jgi:hypothetical protein
MLTQLAHADVVCGWRRNRQDTWKRRLVSRAANRVLQRFFGHRLHDSGCALRVFRRSVADRLLKVDGLHRFFALLAVMEGFIVAEVPVNHRPRLKGESKYGVWNRLFRTLRDLNGLLWYRSRRLDLPDLTVIEVPLSHGRDDTSEDHDAAGRPATIPFRPSGGVGSAGRRKSA